MTVTAAIFAMMLCAITNAYGWKGGLIVGFVHTSMVLNIDVLHGGLNLYNNGFSGGLVAMMIIPLLDLSKQLRRKTAVEQVEDKLADHVSISVDPALTQYNDRQSDQQQITDSSIRAQK